MKFRLNYFVIFLICSLLFVFLFCDKTKSPLEPVIKEIDKAILNDMVENINVGIYGEIHSVLILYNDSLVFEEYFNGCHQNSIECINDATTSISSAIIGIAIQEGYVNSVREKLLPFFVEYSNIAFNDSLKEAITLEHVLTMTAGLSWNDEILNQMYNSRDWIKFTLDRPMSENPGEIFNYNLGGSMLLSGIIQNTTNMLVQNFAKSKLFQPLGIKSSYWLSDGTGKGSTGTGFCLRAFDFLRFGQLYLKKGSWTGQQLISEEWVEISTQKWVKPHQFWWKDNEYGYHWWRYSESHRIAKILQTNDVYFAWGWGDQFLWILPHLEMVVVVTAGNFEKWRAAESILWEYILPAIL